MRIAIPVSKESLEAEVHASFGRAPYFLFYNTETEESRFLDNSAVASQGGAGIRAAQVVADQGAQALITPRCGQNAAEVLQQAEIQIYESISGTARENIEALVANELNLQQDFHAGFHGHGK